jgi:hypothetical protein
MTEPVALKSVPSCSIVNEFGERIAVLQYCSIAAPNGCCYCYVLDLDCTSIIDPEAVLVTLYESARSAAVLPFYLVVSRFIYTLKVRASNNTN